jgi:hypothetical protein
MTITQRLVFSVKFFTALLDNGFQQFSVLGSGIQRLLPSLAVTFQLQITYRVRVRVTVRLAVYSQSVRLGDKPLETYNQHFFSN